MALWGGNVDIIFRDENAIQANLCLVTFSSNHMEIYDRNNGLIFSYSRMPHLFTKDIALVQQLFEALCKVGKHPASLCFSYGCWPGNPTERETLFLSYL